MFYAKIKKIILMILMAVFFADIDVWAVNIMTPDSYAFWIYSNEEDQEAPLLLGCSPESNAVDMPRSTNIQVGILDTQSAIDRSSINMLVNGSIIVNNGNVQTYQDPDGNTCAYQVEIIEKTSNEFILMYDPADYFDYAQTVTVTISAIDSEGNYLNGASYDFKVQDFLVGGFSSFLSAEPTGILSGSQTTDVGFLQDNSVLANSADGKHVFLAWEQRSTAGVWDIYCAQSSDFGETFAAPVKVNPDALGAEQRFPSIAVDSFNNVYISWQQKAMAGDWDIYIAKMNQGENMFSPSYRIYADDNATNQIMPEITAGPTLTNDGQSSTQEPAAIYAVWIEESQEISSVHYARTTSSYSDAWNIFVAQQIRVDDDRWPQQCKDPIIKLDASSRAFVSWRGENEDGTSGIYFDKADKIITDGAESFGEDISVSNNTSALMSPELEISADGNNVYVLWKELVKDQAYIKFSYYRYLDGVYELNVSRVVNAGIFNNDDLGSYDLSIDSRGDATVIWSALENTNRVINMAGAVYNGYAFTEFACLSTSGVQKNPALSMDALGRHYYVSWTDNSNGYDALFFCRNTYIVTDEITSQKIENDTGGLITVSQGNIAGTSVEILPNAIDAPITIVIAESVGAPDAGDGITRIGDVVDCGPGQTHFNIPAKITVPYNNKGLFDASMINEEALHLFCYNIGQMKWEMLSGCVVDTASQTISAPISHFSMYMVADGAPAAQSSSSSSSSSSNGGCFIATAAFGSRMEEEVKILCDFRDQYLLKNVWGIKFVKNYYKYSPAFADKLRAHEDIKALIRICLRPLIGLSRALCK